MSSADDQPPDGGTGERERWYHMSEQLRAYAAAYTYLTHHLARWLGVHSADANAFAEILYAEEAGTPLSPAKLATRISLTSGATTSLLNRLERAKLLVRSREHADRRLVTLRSIPSVTQRSWSFFRPLAGRIDEALAPFSDEEIDIAERVIARINDALTATIEELDAQKPPTSPGPD